MSQPYIGEIRIFAGNFAPLYWAFCDGSLIPITQNETLFQLIGTTYGGDGQTTFALPDLRSRSPIHQGTGGGATYVIGQSGGVEAVTVSVSQLPAHSHVPQAAIDSASPPLNTPANNVWSGWTGAQFTSQAPTFALASSAVGLNGGSQPHDNMVPFQVITFIIALYGIYPSQS